ncbi:MAG: hypothetical protein BWY95_01182 [Bacteroidetes bacterium ADurb.BinA104]|nr:MAG: hypothetical protein BWY95_01182 [Bacteroidetes bacterium ADurb.BinA104]
MYNRRRMCNKQGRCRQIVIYPVDIYIYIAIGTEQNTHILLNIGNCIINCRENAVTEKIVFFRPFITKVNNGFL